MKCLTVLCLGGWLLGAHPFAVAADATRGWVKVVPATEPALAKAATRGDAVGRLLQAAATTVGTPYRWGGTRMDQGIDCSNYTWQLMRSLGGAYERFMSTMTLAHLKRANGLRKVSFENARTGDLLVYGYREASGRWRGHVVILIDKDGRLTGHKGLVLGAHGAGVGAVQYITYAGFEEGYFKEPRLRLANVLRVGSGESPVLREAARSP